MSPFDDVLAFHQTFLPGQIHSVPTILPSEQQQLWVNLVEEEMRETLNALRGSDLTGIADGIADSIYVLCGAAIQYGIPLPEIWAAVHEANMQKRGGEARQDGKVLKPNDWVKPDIAGILKKHSRAL